MPASGGFVLVQAGSSDRNLYYDKKKKKKTRLCGGPTYSYAAESTASGSFSFIVAVSNHVWWKKSL